MARTMRVTVPDAFLEDAARARIRELEAEVRRLQKQVNKYKQAEEQKTAVTEALNRLRQVVREVDDKLYEVS
ncbi:MAG: hypothetical protein QXS50_04280 [Candidatus Caldarchaeum sp.]